MDKVRTLLNVSTTPSDIYRIAGKICNIFTYPEIKKYKNINNLFKKGNSPIANDCNLKLPFDSKCCIILYMSGPNYGHWTCLTKNEFGINFMDSYGGVIDDQLEHVDQNIPGQDKKYLIKLLSKYKGDVYYNDIQMQTMNQNIATCGRYCALYLKYDYMKVDDFVKKIKELAAKNKLTCDQIVCILSS